MTTREIARLYFPEEIPVEVTRNTVTAPGGVMLRALNTVMDLANRVYYRPVQIIINGMVVKIEQVVVS